MGICCVSLPSSWVGIRSGHDPGSQLRWAAHRPELWSVIMMNWASYIPAVGPRRHPVLRERARSDSFLVRHGTKSSEPVPRSKAWVLVQGSVRWMCVLVCMSVPAKVPGVAIETGSGSVQEQQPEQRQVQGQGESMSMQQGPVQKEQRYRPPKVGEGAGQRKVQGWS